MLDSASIILRRSLRSQASSRAVLVEVAALIHGLLEGIALPAKDVITVSGGATVFVLTMSAHLFSLYQFDGKRGKGAWEGKRK